MRLVALKPGVVIRETRLPWHQAEALAEAKWIATYFRPFFTKLAVSPRDAIPLSIVNLRSAMKSSESETLERQLSLLLTRRLSQQRELFVLERRRMDLVTAETELQGIDETPFWNGSYLLDGVIDRDGYSKEILTIHARLAPPKGGVSLSIEISGARTNLPPIITELTAKVLEGLKLAPHIGGVECIR